MPVVLRYLGWPAFEIMGRSRARLICDVATRFDEGARLARELKRAAPKVKAVLLTAGESYQFPGQRSRRRLRPMGKSK